MTRRDQHDQFDDGELERPGLVWQRGERGDVEYAIWPERPVTIGRDPTNTISIESPFVSKAHAIFQFANGEYVLEDLGSANGTRVNGAPVETAVVQPGDVIEIGDQRFLFVDRSTQSSPALKRGGLGKNAKLGLVAVGTCVVMGGLMMLLVASGSSSQARPRAAGPGAEPPRTAAGATPIADIRPDPVQVNEVVARAEKAGVNPVDALFDEAMLQYRGRRLRDTAQLLAEVQRREPKHPIAAQRFADVRRELEQAITLHSSQASQAFSQLRLQHAVQEWEQVLLLADSADPRYREAQDGIKRAAERGIR